MASSLATHGGRKHIYMKKEAAIHREPLSHASDHSRERDAQAQEVRTMAAAPRERPSQRDNCLC